MSTSLSINLKRASKVYHEGEMIAGVVVVSSGGEVRHEGLSLQVEGSVSLQLSSKSVGLLEAFSNNIKDLGITRLLPSLPTFLRCEVTSRFADVLKSKISTAEAPINLISTTMELAPAGRIPAGVTEIPFEVPLRARVPHPGLLETYHGVFVNVMYVIKCTMKRSFLNKPLNASCQFFVQYRHQDPAPLKPVRCEITPATIRAAGGGGGGKGSMPQFQVYAEIHSTVCALDKPLTGKIRVDECSVPIKSIELQLVRVETCGCAEGYSKDATEIQNIQIGDGDVCRGRDLPLHMVLPRLFTCPTTTTVNFKIEFELNVAVIFEDDYLVTENFPILLLRSR